MDDERILIVDGDPKVVEFCARALRVDVYQLRLTRQHAGLTLGLSTVEDPVELHQGRVWVESQPEKGSTFCFTISRHLVPQPENY